MKRLLALAAVVVGALALLPSGATSAPAAPGFPPDRPTKVLVLGDSVMLGAADQDVAALGERDVTVDAAVNRSTNQGAEKLAELGTDWDVVVVMLGHNDGGSPGAYQPAAISILDQLRDVPAVIWVNIHEVRDYYPAVNEFIASQQETYPNLTIADWSTIADANPDALSGDGLHMKPEGADLMARLVADQVHAAEMLEAAPATTTSTAPPATTTAPGDAVDAEGEGDDARTGQTIATEPASASEDADRPTGAGPEDDGPPVVALAGVGLAVVAMVGGLVLYRSRRQETQRDADNAG